MDGCAIAARQLDNLATLQRRAGRKHALGAALERPCPVREDSQRRARGHTTRLEGGTELERVDGAQVAREVGLRGEGGGSGGHGGGGRWVDAWCGHGEGNLGGSVGRPRQIRGCSDAEDGDGRAGGGGGRVGGWSMRDRAVGKCRRGGDGGAKVAERWKSWADVTGSAVD